MAGYDTEWQAAMHMLRAPLIADKTAPCINVAKREIDWDRLPASLYASSERLLGDVAFALWRGIGSGSDVARAVHLLGEPAWRRFLEALELARGDRPDLATYRGGRS